MKKPVVLCILDGCGMKSDLDGNAYAAASTPNFDRLLKEYPNSQLEASGNAVGLPEGQIGNSEVGHLCIGAGEIVYTGLNLINQAIKDKTFFQNEAFLEIINHVKKNQSTLHLMGLLSPGGVHSHETHLFALLDLLYQQGLDKVVVHAYGDGRDVKPRSIKPSIVKLMVILNKYHFQLGSICGRYYAMDRDTNFNLTNQAYQMLLKDCHQTWNDPLEYVDQEYAKDVSDEFFHPGINQKYQGMKSNDGIIFFNFRPDRARQLTHLLIGSELYKDKPKQPRLTNLKLVSMMKYEKIEKAIIAFGSMKVDNPIGKVLSEHKIKQLRLAETQKYAHVTFFMDGGIDIEYPHSERIMIPSLKVKSYADAPQMSAYEITDALILKLNDVEVVIMNFANCDMVGHTGDYQAAVKAVSIIDECIGKMQKAIEKAQGTLFITADHGNVETMCDENGSPATKHTTSPVFLITTDKSLKLQNGILSDVAPTILDYLQIPQPASMKRKSLIIKK